MNKKEVKNIKIIDTREVLDGIDEDLKKFIIPILEEVNLILKDNLLDESDALYQFNYRLKLYYKKIDIEKLNIELQKYLKNGISKVEDRVFKILFPNND